MKKEKRLSYRMGTRSLTNKIGYGLIESYRFYGYDESSLDDMEQAEKSAQLEILAEHKPMREKSCGDDMCDPLDKETDDTKNKAPLFNDCPTALYTNSEQNLKKHIDFKA